MLRIAGPLLAFAVALASAPANARAGADKVDTANADEVIDAIAKTVAELTSQQEGLFRQQVIEQLMRQIMHLAAGHGPAAPAD